MLPILHNDRLVGNVPVTLIGKPGSDGQPLAFALAFEQATRLRVAPNL